MTCKVTINILYGKIIFHFFTQMSQYCAVACLFLRLHMQDTPPQIFAVLVESDTHFGQKQA